MFLDNREMLPTTEFDNATVEESVVARSNPPVVDAVYTAIACLALLGNGMVIAVMLVRRKVFSSFTNRLILHQSVVDSVAGVMFFLHQVVKKPNIPLSEEGNFWDQLLCRLVETDILLWWANVASTYNLVIIALERFAATCHPVRHRRTCSGSRLRYAVGASWAMGFIYTLPSAALREPHQGRCISVPHGTVYQVGVVTHNTIDYILPVSVMAYTYARILKVLTKKLTNQRNGCHLSRAKKNVIKTSLLTGVMFLVCWTPTAAFSIYAVFINRFWVLHPTFWIVYRLVAGLVACNACVNPIIYSFMYRHFRTHLKDVLLKRWHRNRVRGAESVQIATAS
ncbi:galanin receptor type 2-like [Acanthaster planci]|uniref:Galanin receptor type 2-like n=1 Tax=Acanthaster planci TaxID=133434 RepID=A0A8B7YBL1_ACAPL|nr:galanin receptor type 2-like [Acanthaster planci]